MRIARSPMRGLVLLGQSEVNVRRRSKLVHSATQRAFLSARAKKKMAQHDLLIVGSDAAG